MDNPGKSAVYPEQPHRNFLERKKTSCMQQCMTCMVTANVKNRWEFPHSCMSSFACVWRQTPTFLDAFQYLHFVNISGQILKEIVHFHFVDWGGKGWRHCSLPRWYTQKQHIYACLPKSVLELIDVSHVMAVRSSSDILSFFCMLQFSGKKFSTWLLIWGVPDESGWKNLQGGGCSTGFAPGDILLFTFSTCTFLIPAEAQQQSSCPLRVVELHTRCLWKRVEKLRLHATNAVPTGCRRISSF